MFEVIEPKYQCFYKSLIERFIEPIKLCPPLGFELSHLVQNRTTFILGEDKEKGVYGGALLFKERLHDCPKELVTPLSDFIPLQEDIWKCVISMSFKNDSPLYTTGKLEFFCQTLYRNLYDILVEFGERERTGFLCVSLDPREFLCTEGLIFWPYVCELKPRNSSDGFFHGILPLTGSQYEAYKKICQALDFSYQERKLK